MPSPAEQSPDSTSSGRTGAAHMPIWKTAQRLALFAIEVNPRAFMLTVVLSLVGSLAEGAGLLLLLPLLSVAGMTFTGSSTASRIGSGAQQLLLHTGVSHGFWLPLVLGVFLVTGTLRSMLRRSQNLMAYTTTTAVQLALSRQLYESIVKAQWGYLVRQRSGNFTHLLTEELRRVSDAISLTFSLINAAFLTLLYLGIAIKLSAAMTFLVLGMGVVVMLFQRSSIGRARVSGEALSVTVGEVYAATEEHLHNLKSVKTYDAEDRDVQMFAKLCSEVARQSVISAKHRGAAVFGFEAGSLVALGTVVSLALGVLHVQAATMLLLLAIFTRLMPQLASLQSQTHQYANILPAFDHIVATESECKSNAEPTTAVGDALPVPPLSLHSELRVNDIWFAYQGSIDQMEPQFVLRGIDLSIRAGMLTAITGPSGAGKSTLADLVNGLLVPTRGHLTLDGRTLDAGKSRQWRRQVGYVGQETVLFHESVRNNLLWARPDATDDEIRVALTNSSAEFVYDLPGGLESIVGDRGILLSSGQRQRISLARALLRQPTLLILDEATNALDVENEARILETIQGLRGTLTILMVAHRASALRRADRIFELEAGRISRFGSWTELNPSFFGDLR